MAFPTINYDASGGSDTGASGAGPATPITGTTATVNGGDPGTVIDLDGSPDLSAVATDGSAVIWLNTSAGTRHLHRITAVNDGADQVTIEDSITLGGGVAWAIGGKRQTREADATNNDLTQLKSGWTAEFEDGDYSSTVIAPISQGDVTDGPVTIRAADGHSPRFIVSTTEHIISTSGSSTYLRISGIEFVPAGARAAIFIGASANFDLDHCVFDLANASSTGVFVNSGLLGTMWACYFTGSGGSPFKTNSGRHFFEIVGNSFDGSADNGISLDSATSLSTISIHHNLIRNATDSGIAIGSINHNHITIANNTIDGCGQDGIEISAAANENYTVTILDNILSNHTSGSGINTTANQSIVCDRNGFYNNNVHRTNIPAGPEDVEISSDPYADYGSGDLSLNDTAGAGADFQQIAVPLPDGINTSYKTLGAIESQGAGGGGGSALINRGIFTGGKL